MITRSAVYCLQRRSLRRFRFRLKLLDQKIFDAFLTFFWWEQKGTTLECLDRKARSSWRHQYWHYLYYVRGRTSSIRVNVGSCKRNIFFVHTWKKEAMFRRYCMHVTVLICTVCAGMYWYVLRAFFHWGCAFRQIPSTETGSNYAAGWIDYSYESPSEVWRPQQKTDYSLVREFLVGIFSEIILTHCRHQLWQAHYYS